MEKPRVSVGLPVYNGEDYLKPAIESVLAQTYCSFELIISDNASTDGTEEICKTFANQDKRIRYHRNESNIGLFKNWDKVFELSTGEYFLWLAHDDVIAPEYLKKATEIFDNDPSVVVCYAKECAMNSEGTIYRDEEFPNKWDSFDLRERLHDALFVAPYSTSGMMRSSALRQTRLNLEFIGSDWNLAVELALLGRFVEIPERLFFRRHHAKMSTKLYTKHERMAFSNPAKAREISFPTWRQTYEYFRSINKFVPSFKDRVLCQRELWNWIMFERTRVDLKKDIRMALKKVLRSHAGEKNYQNATTL